MLGCPYYANPSKVLTELVQKIKPNLRNMSRNSVGLVYDLSFDPAGVVLGQLLLAGSRNQNITFCLQDAALVRRGLGKAYNSAMSLETDRRTIIIQHCARVLVLQVRRLSKETGRIRSGLINKYFCRLDGATHCGGLKHLNSALCLKKNTYSPLCLTNNH